MRLNIVLAIIIVAGFVPAGTMGGAADPPEPPGCSGYTDPDANVPPFDRNITEAARGYNITVRGGKLPFDANLTFARTEALVDRNASQSSITVVIVEADGDDDQADGREPNRFRRLLGFENSSWWKVARPSTGAALRAESLDTIPIPEWLLEYPGLAESVLAHEFVHHIQFQMAASALAGKGHYDCLMAHKVGLEGVADYLQLAYWQRYIDEGRNPYNITRRSYARGSVSERWNLAPYYFGTQYVRAMSDDPEDALAIFENPPRTTEQVLHDRPPGSASVAPLSVTARSGRWTVQSRTRMGEMFLRVVTSGQLNRSAAADAAAGWGNDRRVVYRNEHNATSYAWVIRWDDAANASEFATAFDRYLDRRASRTGDLWRSTDGFYRLTRVNDTTTVVLLGNRSFVEETVVATTAEGVVVRPPGSETPTPTPTPTATPSRTTVTSPSTSGKQSPATGGTPTSPATNPTTSPGPGPALAAAAVLVALLVLFGRS